MAGMFYSLQEAAQKLGTSEDQIRQLAKDGRLREFRDGPNLLFKIDEVEALASELGPVSPPEVPIQPAEPTEAAEVVEPVQAEEPQLGPIEELEIPEETAEPQFELEPDAEAMPEFDLDLEAAVGPEAQEIPELDLDLEGTAGAEPSAELEPQAEIEPEPEAQVELEPAGEPEAAGQAEPALDFESTSELGLDAEPGTAEGQAMGEAETPGEPAELDEDEILLAESGITGAASDITDMDTALTGEGISVLGETDSDYQVTDDTMAETVGPTGTSTEASLEEIEEDVNLDSFGSGSGLLDLSLQADDTSLGGILDEIYTAEGGEQAAEPAAPGSAEDVAAEADQMISEEALAPAEPVAMMPTAMVQPLVEAAPDTQSNMFGMLLLLPALALLYTTIVTLAGLRGFVPSVLEPIQAYMWYIVIGGVVVAAAVTGAALVLGGQRAERAPREAKAKGKKAKEKKPKEKKVKEKKPKEPKPKKAKKKGGLFGKKK